MKQIFTALTTLAFGLTAAQAQNTDTAKVLKQVTIKGYLSEQPVLSAPASVGVVSSAQLQLQPSASFVPALNTVPGVRAEERSPGSYRLSVRGSLLRSPFGVRNIKVYYDEIPLTDAGGNTYLNALDFNSIHNMEILKGPDGSLFGANTGGVVLLNSSPQTDAGVISAGVNAGSYGLFHQNAGVQQQWGNYGLSVNQAYQSYGGYRQNSYMYRHFVNTTNRYKYGNGNEVKALAFYSDLNYQTPGGLNQAQMEADPRSARQPTATLPGALQQKVGIRQKMYFGGLVNNWQINERLKNVAAVFGNHVDFANPFITNYEFRNEDTYGLRTYFELNSVKKPDFDWKLDLGVEWQQTNSTIANYDNNGGTRGDVQATDRLNTNQHFIFTRYAATLFERFNIEAAVSLNYFKYRFKNIDPANEANFSERDFDAQLMPRLALSYLITNNFSWRASVSRGYSSPTNLEVRPSNNVVNTNLNAQTGWNYESGFRLRNNDESTFLDVSAFYFRMQNTIVPRRLENETEYYVNAGGTNQPGAELYFSSWLLRKGTGFVKGLQFNTSYTFSKYSFRSYSTAGADFSGNRLTGIPRNVVVSNVQLLLPQSVSLFVQHNFTDRIPLNDGNTVYAPKYNLLQARVGWQYRIGKTRLEVFAAADNLLNQKYSLGNDLNAIGNRYYNPAPLRNYNAGLNVAL
ncbi:TonB-dependent receptor [Mucilaginibacter sp. JRF]|uniref:TonB-dependent receptor n=1 Tax=Mucilaginibacter sp. JRF TaxID=2780088 RepID=UPI0032218245